MVGINADASLSGLKTGDLVLFTGQGLALCQVVQP